MKLLTCEMRDNCHDVVTHIDTKGFVYCQAHAVLRKRSGYAQCRALAVWERKKLEAGETISYARKPKPVTAPPQSFVSLYAPALNTPDRIQAEHTSSLMFGGRVAPGLLCVVGVLPHMHQFQPISAADRDLLVTFLKSIKY